jgi:hypothetical protein
MASQRNSRICCSRGLPTVLGRVGIIARNLSDAKLAERSTTGGIAAAAVVAVLLAVKLQQCGQNTATVILWRFRDVIELVGHYWFRAWKYRWLDSSRTLFA